MRLSTDRIRGELERPDESAVGNRKYQESTERGMRIDENLARR